MKFSLKKVRAGFFICFFLFGMETFLLKKTVGFKVHIIYSVHLVVYIEENIGKKLSATAK